MSDASIRRRIASFILMLLILLRTTPALPAFQLPKNLSRNDRIKALQIAGLGSSTKILSDPYPLGGYWGFEAGLTIENLQAEDLGRLGQGLSSPQQDITLSGLSIGKGLYNNIDVFIHFTPYARADEISQYGGLIRWGFYQATALPLSFSALMHANNANFNNQMNTYAYGIDFIAGVNVEHLALFAGLGTMEAKGTFPGGDSGITDSGATETEFVTGGHTVIGADIRIRNAFITLQIDRYSLPVFSGKLGFRF